MLKRTISILLCAVMIFTMALSLCACKGENSDEYPVTIGETTIQKEPMNIVVLSDCMADIISYMRYDVKMVGRSVETDQEFLSVVPIVGTASDPNVSSIISSETDLVIAENTISDKAKKELTDAKIPILTLKKATSFAQLKALYTDLGTALGGNVTGKEKGVTAYNELVNTLDNFKDAVPHDVIKTACYLYLDENGNICTFTKGSIEYELFSYCGAANTLSSQEKPTVDLEQLKISTPTFIFYDSQEVLDKLITDSELSQLSAIKEENTMQVEKRLFNRQGTTYEDTIYRMIEFMFISKEATLDEATADSAKTDTTEADATEATTATQVGFVE